MRLLARRVIPRRAGSSVAAGTRILTDAAVKLHFRRTAGPVGAINAGGRLVLLRGAAAGALDPGRSAARRAAMGKGSAMRRSYI